MSSSGSAVITDHVLVTFKHDSKFWLLGGLGFNEPVVVTTGTVLISLFEHLHILTEDLLALLACEDHFSCLHEFMVFLLFMALRAVIPLLTAIGTNGN